MHVNTMWQTSSFTPEIWQSHATEGHNFSDVIHLYALQINSSNWLIAKYSTLSNLKIKIITACTTKKKNYYVNQLRVCVTMLRWN